MAEDKHLSTDSPKKHDAIQGEIVHEYDGILEADNELPRWWLATFFLTIVFSAGYWFYYEGFAIGRHPVVLYADEMAARAAEGGEVTEEMLATFAGDPAMVADGAHIFETNCVVCHGARGEGNIGPNLTDSAWIHGGTPVEIHATISNGVAARGMPAWSATLGRDSVLRAVAFVLSVRDTNVPGRAPEGPRDASGAALPLPAPTPTEALPAEGATPTEAAVPAEGAAPAEGSVPAEGTAPAAPTEGAAPIDGAAAAPTGAAPATP
jgi:cytochrome c oxidase cbb3-type subunit 3